MKLENPEHSIEDGIVAPGNRPTWGNGLCIQELDQRWAGFEYRVAEQSRNTPGQEFVGEQPAGPRLHSPAG